MNSQRKISAKIIPANALNDRHREQMLKLMQSYFDGVLKEKFEKDLEEKEQVIILEDEAAKCILGFSAFCVMRTEIEGKDAAAFYSGDTILDRSVWGSFLLEKEWLRFIFLSMEQEQQKTWFWFLVCKGYRTYRYLPVYFQHYLPGAASAPSDFERKALDTFAAQRFGKHYDPASSLIRCPGDYRLRDGISEIGEQRRRNASIAYFEQLNPGWKNGDELACLVPLTKTNLKKPTHKLLESAMRMRPQQ